jgi:hypothetical protein
VTELRQGVREHVRTLYPPTLTRARADECPA